MLELHISGSTSIVTEVKTFHMFSSTFSAYQFNLSASFAHNWDLACYSISNHHIIK